MVIGTAPVSDHNSLKPPVVPQYILEQVLILVCIDPVNFIIAGHQCLRPAFFYRDLKSGEVYLPEGTFIQHRIHRHPALFLAVHRKMFWTGSHSLALDTPYITGCQFTGKIRIFRKILKIPPAQRASLNIKTRPQENIYSQSRCLTSQRCTDLFCQLNIPAVSNCCRSRKTGG